MSIKKYLFKLNVLCDLSCLGIMQSFVRESALVFGFSGDDLSRIELAFEEGVTNVIEHAFQNEEDPQTFDIICERVRLGMRIIIREKGIPFDPDKVPEFKPSDDIEHLNTSGMGLFLMRESMDQVAFFNLGTEGKETYLIKYFPQKNIRSYLTTDDQETGTHDNPELIQPSVKIPYTVRRMLSDEAIEVSRCAYKAYGYSLFDDLIYYPERIIELNATDEMISAVAVADDNVLMGHAALVYPAYDEKIAEFNFAFVNPDYRNQECLEQMGQFLLSTPKKNELLGVYTYSAANHVYFQSEVIKLGYTDCAIYLAKSPARAGTNSIHDTNKKRISSVQGYYYVKKAEPLQIYAPLHHRKMISQIYENMVAHHIYTNPETTYPVFNTQESQIETTVYNLESRAEILIKNYGSNIVREIRGILKDLCCKQIAVINLSIPLEDSVTWFITEEIEKLGFFFAGILPLTIIGDTLILQYINNVNLNYDKIQVYSENAKELLAYVKAHDPNADI